MTFFLKAQSVNETVYYEACVKSDLLLTSVKYEVVGIDAI